MTKIVTTLDLFAENHLQGTPLFIQNDNDTGSGSLTAPLFVFGDNGTGNARTFVDLFIQQQGKVNEEMPLSISGPASAVDKITLPLLIQNFGGSSFDDIELFLRGTSLYYYYTLQYYFDAGTPTMNYTIDFPTIDNIELSTDDTAAEILDECRTHFALSDLNFVDVTGSGTIADPFIIKIRYDEPDLAATISFDITSGGDITATYTVGNPAYDELTWIFSNALPSTDYDIVLEGLTASLNTTMDLATINSVTNAAWGDLVYASGYYNTHIDDATNINVTVFLRPGGLSSWSYDYDVYTGEGLFVTQGMPLLIGRGTPVEDANMPLFISQQTNNAVMPMFVQAQRIEESIDLVIEGKYHSLGNVPLVVPVVHASGNGATTLFTHGY
jgi:hypothetical protein